MSDHQQVLLQHHIQQFEQMHQPHHHQLYQPHQLHHHELMNELNTNGDLNINREEVDLIDSSGSQRKPKGYWTKERCHAEALKYRTKSEFNSGSTSAYSATLQNKWFDEIAEHLVTDRKPKGDNLKRKLRIEFTITYRIRLLDKRKVSRDSIAI